MKAKIIKKLIFGFTVLSTLLTVTSCSYADPVEFNNTLVSKMDSLVGYQSEFVDALGKKGDTMKVAYDAMNNYAEKSLNSIKSLPEYDDGADFNKSVVQIINNLKNTNESAGRNMMDLYTKSNSRGEFTYTDYGEMDKIAIEFDKSWQNELRNFDLAQKKFAEKTGIAIQQVGKSFNK